MRKNLILLLLTLCTVCMSAQQLQTPNTKFGKPTNEELTMSTYTRDTSATAVVLCQLTSIKYDVGSDMSMTQETEVKTRIKILKPEGKEYADISIPFIYDPSKEHAQQKIIDLKVVTYNMVNGKMKKTVLPDNLVFRKNLGDNHYTMNFSAANVQAGSVVEYSYTKWSNIWSLLDDYYAQDEIPVAYCHYNAEIPSLLQLNFQYSRRPDFTATTSRSSITLPSNAYGEEPVSLSTNVYEATGRFLPALKSDDYLYCPQDYSAQITNELRAVQFPGQAPYTFTNNWEDVDKTLLAYAYFGGSLNSHSKLKDEIDASGIANIIDFKEKVAALYKLMRSHVTWNGKYKLLPDVNNNPVKSGTGTSADLNMLFINMLNDVGITNHPVIMSSRSNGQLSPIFANLEHLNTFIVAVFNGSNTYYVDASSKDGFLDVLPSEVIVNKARMIGKGVQSKWVNMQNISYGQTTISEVVDVDANGIESTSSNIRYHGNASLSEKQRYHSAKDSVTWVSSMADKYGITIEDYKIKGPETYSDETEENITYKRQLDSNGNIIYISPFTLRLSGSNPFKEEKRDMPLEFPYKSRTTYIVNINIPEGYQPEELPHYVEAKTPDNGLSTSVNFNYDAQLHKIQATMSYSVNKMTFNANEYEALKTMFDRFIDVCNSTIAIKKG